MAGKSRRKLGKFKNKFEIETDFHRMYDSYSVSKYDHSNPGNGFTETT